MVLGQLTGAEWGPHRWCEASPSVRTPRNHSVEAVNSAEGHQDGSDVQSGPEVNTEEWEVVSRRKRKRLNAADNRGIIIWGVPPSMSIQTLSTFLLNPLGKVKRDAMQLE